MITDKKIESLKCYFQNRTDIAFAFLYGSQARGNATRLSDADVAVYFYPRTRHPIECEEDIFYESEDDIWSDLERLLKKDVEILVLNRAFAVVAASAIRGVPLVIHDWGLYLDFMEVITDLEEDYSNFIINDYNKRMKLETGN